MHFHTNWEPDGVYQTFSGHLSEIDRREAEEAVIGDSRFDTIHYWIIDTLEISSYDLNERSATLAAGTDLGAAHINRHILEAFVTTNSDQRLNIERYASILKEIDSPWTVQVFTDVVSARAWIAQTLKEITEAETRSA